MKMRRFKQEISEDESKSILRKATNGVLSLIDKDGRPYGVPLSFIYDGGKAIYFHCALEGRKLDCIYNNPKACFTVIEMDEIHPEEFTTYFRSVIVEGKISILSERQEMINVLRHLSTKYSPGIDCETEIEKGINRVLILKFEIEILSGKEAIELVKRRV